MNASSVVPFQGTLDEIAGVEQVLRPKVFR
jgi:hypothetical protein